MTDIVERLRSSEPLPACPFDKISSLYLTMPDDKPCPFCGQENTLDGPDKCRGADTRIFREAADEIDRLQAGAGMAKYWREQYLLVRAHMEKVRAALNLPVPRDAVPLSDELSELEQQFMHVLDGWEEDGSSPAAVSALQYALGAVRDAMYRSRNPVGSPNPD